MMNGIEQVTYQERGIYPAVEEKAVDDDDDQVYNRAFLYMAALLSAFTSYH